MAQLNCPTCHVHGMSAWDWNRSQMNLNAFPPWPGGIAPGNTWHGSVMFPPSYRMPTGELPRRGSLHSQRHGRRTRKFSSEDDTESDLSVSDDRKSRRRSSPAMRCVSPAMSRRSRRTLPSDTEEELMSRKSDRRFKKRGGGVLPSREPSPALSRRSYRKKYDDEDAMSVKSASSRRNLKSPGHRTFLRKNVRHSSTDSDDELTSERDVSEKVSLSGSHSETRSIPKLTTKTAETETQSELQRFPKPANLVQPSAAEKIGKDTPKPQSQHQSVQMKNSDWECEHCTYLNANASRVCDVCCKSRTSDTAKGLQTETENVLAESMKNLSVSTANSEEKKKGRPHKRSISFWLGTKLYS